MSIRGTVYFTVKFFLPLYFQLSMGHRCVSHYRRLNRTTVFSHEELVCKMAANPDNLDLNLAKAIYDDMVSMVEQESQLQQKLKDQVRDY